MLIERLRLRLRSSHLALPAFLTVIFAFHAGAFFPSITGVSAALIAIGLAARFTLAASPLAGVSLALCIAAGGLVVLAAWTLASALWSDAPVRALAEFDRVLVYLGALVLMGTFAARRGDLEVSLRWMTLALAAVCVVAVLTRLLPAQLPTEAGVLNERLAFPVTYWNALGLVAALGLVLALHGTASEREPGWVRVASAAAMPAMALTLYFTFSRGPTWMLFPAVLAYLALAHPRGAIGAVLGAGPPLALAVSTAYRAELLADPDIKTAAATSQAEHVLLMLALATALAAVLRWLALIADRRLTRVELSPRQRRRALAVAGAVGLVAVVSVSFALEIPQRFDEQRRGFVAGNVVPLPEDLRERFTQPGNNGRLDFWRVARTGFEAAPVRGQGAGTYQLRWERERAAPPVKVRDGHSLYLELAGELGLVGLLSLAAALAAVLWGGMRRLRCDGRHAGAAFLVAGLLLLGHAAVDWDWEMPVLFAWFFGVGGVALARPHAERLAWEPPRLARLVIGLACLLLAILPAQVAVSQSRLHRGVDAFARGDCATAIDASLDALDVLAVRPEPFELLGYCNARAGRYDLAVRAMRSARRRDPDNWEYAYGLAIMQTLAGQDGRPTARVALRLNPLEPKARELARGLRSRSPRARRQAAASADLPFG